MGLEPLLEGKCVVRKNRAPHQVFSGSLVFDDDLRKYKILANGVIAYAFGPLQIKSTDYDVSGKIRKRSSMGIYVNSRMVTSTSLTSAIATTNNLLRPRR